MCLIIKYLLAALGVARCVLPAASSFIPFTMDIPMWDFLGYFNDVHIDPNEIRQGFVVNYGMQTIIKEVYDGLDLFYFRHVQSNTNFYVLQNNTTREWHVLYTSE